MVATALIPCLTWPGGYNKFLTKLFCSYGKEGCHWCTTEGSGVAFVVYSLLWIELHLCWICTRTCIWVSHSVDKCKSQSVNDTKEMNWRMNHSNPDTKSYRIPCSIKIWAYSGVFGFSRQTRWQKNCPPTQITFWKFNGKWFCGLFQMWTITLQTKFIIVNI